MINNQRDNHSVQMFDFRMKTGNLFFNGTFTQIFETSFLFEMKYIGNERKEWLSDRINVKSELYIHSMDSNNFQQRILQYDTKSYH
jgi:hypothetical protein